MQNKNFRTSNADTEDDEQTEPAPPHIVDVWAHNFQQHLADLQTLSHHHSVISLDTEFPGNPIKKHTIAHLCPSEDIEYQLVWHNVEKTKLIQVGITLADASGKLASPCTYQFHLAFDLPHQKTDPDSIALLKTAGIPFDRLALYGIPASRFAEGLISSGLILNKNLTWVVFHGCYDFAYLLKLLRDEPLPAKAEDFYKSIRIYFPNIFDLKEIIRDEEHLKEGGLNSLAAKLGCQRIGPKHQAGSDSLLTIQTFFQLKNLLGASRYDQHLNSIYGIPKPQQKITTHQYPSMTYQQTYNGGPLYQYLQLNSYGWTAQQQPYTSFGFGKRN